MRSCYAIIGVWCYDSYYEKFSDGTIKCIAGEIPFVLPPGWCWERLGNVSSIARGGSPRPIDDYLTDSHEGVNWIKISDTEKDGKFIHNTKELSFIYFQFLNLELCNSNSEDLHLFRG